MTRRLPLLVAVAAIVVLALGVTHAARAATDPLSTPPAAGTSADSPPGRSLAALRPAGLLDPVCSLLHHSFALSTGCSLADRGLTATRQLAAGNTSAAVGGLLSGAAGDVASVALNGIAGAAATAARFALDQTASLISATTSPRLQAPWFERVYWRLAGIAVLLTLPCLLAAVVQCIVRSDLALLVRATFGYLPAAMLAVGVTAQIAALCLSATDALCALVSGAAGDVAPAFLDRAGVAIVALSVGRSPFLALMIALFTVAGAVVLWLELMIREAAVYVVVAMLPLAFAGLVWPARRIWALRAVELLGALILAKLAIVTVLTLGGAALTQSPGAAGFLAGLVLLVLGAFSPWAMLRMLPLGDIAGGAAGRLRADAGLGSGPEPFVPAARDLAQGLASRIGARPGDGQATGDTPQTAAESVIEHLNSGTSGDVPVPSAAPGLGEPGESAAPAANAGGELDLSAWPATAGAGDSDSDGASTRRPTSMFAAPDESWPTLVLGQGADWSPRSPAPAVADDPPLKSTAEADPAARPASPGPATPGAEPGGLIPEPEPGDGEPGTGAWPAEDTTE